MVDREDRVFYDLTSKPPGTVSLNDTHRRPATHGGRSLCVSSTRLSKEARAAAKRLATVCGVSIVGWFLRQDFQEVSDEDDWGTVWRGRV